MKKLTQKIVEEALAHIIDPVSGRDVISASMVKGLQISNQNDVIFLIEVDPAKGAELEP
ncbi:MAG: iron-sulfur cluster assembly protein, partial [Bdellovibrionales bacterium]